jgi:hypothetical protein
VGSNPTPSAKQRSSAIENVNSRKVRSGSVGAPCPDGTIASQAGSVVLLNAEADVAGTIRFLVGLKNDLGVEASGLAFEIIEDQQGRPVIAWESEPIPPELTADKGTSHATRATKRWRRRSA